MDHIRFLCGVLCHQLPTRTQVFGGHALPLCARCTGLYLGVTLSFLYLFARRRTRCKRGLALNSLILCAILLGLIGGDGLGSLLSLWRSPVWLRVLSGLGAGCSLVFVLFPIMVPLLWETAEERPVLSGGREHLLTLTALFLLGLTVVSGLSPLYWPIIVLSVLGVGVTLVGVNLLLGMVFRKCGGGASEGRDLLAPVAVAAIISWMELSVLGLVRAWWVVRL